MSKDLIIPETRIDNYDNDMLEENGFQVNPYDNEEEVQELNFNHE